MARAWPSTDRLLNGLVEQRRRDALYDQWRKNKPGRFICAECGKTRLDADVRRIVPGGMVCKACVPRTGASHGS